jgi:hypothetical protein
LIMCPFWSVFSWDTRWGVWDLLKSLGFLVNKEKSTLIPTQTLDYLGGLFHLDKGLIYPTQERIAKLNETAKTLFRSIGCYDYRRFLEIEKIGLSACSLNLTTKWDVISDVE